jgi:haloacid dehalogenase superfamily, subfamily IA, variant 1 with third motif having Dx(3-4)D or Dx(3-4)E
MVSLIAFDLDGTLIDSKKDIADSLNAALRECGFPTLAQQKIEELVGRGARQLVKEALGNPSDEQLWRVFENFWRIYDLHCLDQTMLYPGVREFLDLGVPQTLAVITNKPQHFTKKILEGLKIDSRFRWIIGGDTLPVQKPDPAVLQPILADWQDGRNALIVGDSDIDIQLGRAAVWSTCAVTYGFRPREELQSLRPDFIIDRFAELKDLPVFKTFAAREVS